MKIASWNVNSVRARLPNILDWLRVSEPDVLLMQEIKCQTEDFPFFEFQSLGYECHVVGQKSYNGVAMLSRHKVTDLLTALPYEDSDDQARYVEGTIKGLRVGGLYAPNGNPVGADKFDYKLKWMERLSTHIKKHLQTEVPLILGGDFNVMPADIDVYDPKGWEDNALFHPATHKAYREILNLGMTEAFRALHPDIQEYSFWDYQGGAWQRNEGLRIDLFLLSPEAADLLQGCTIDRTPRDQPKASDHVPVILDLAL